MGIYAFTIFLSSILLFQVQLIIAKYILPWFGGTPAVWSTSMLFFQIVLTGGYAYSHGIISKLSLKKQSRVHITLLSTAVFVLFLQAIFWKWPLLPSLSWRHIGSDMPITRILWLLTASVGLPFFTLSTTSSLLQAWFAKKFPNRSPYKLFALSNTGSLLGLLGYPFLIEPILGLKHQGIVWSLAYAIFVLSCGFTAYMIGKLKEDESDSSNAEVKEAVEEDPQSSNPTLLKKTLWLTLTAGASIVLLATTNQVSDEVAVIPFLWAIPLSIYLLTFILSFSSRYLYWRPLFVLGGILMMFFVGRTMFKMLEIGAPIIEQLIVYYVALFICCMLCHGELVKLRPGTKNLTQFYLFVSIGGALGGVFVALIAPFVFQGLWELYIGYFVCGFATFIAIIKDKKSLLNIPKWGWSIRLPAGALVILLAIGPFFLLVDRLPQTSRTITLAVAEKLKLNKFLPEIDPNVKVIAMRRNFYGILRVEEKHAAILHEHRRSLFHGQTMHGFQFMGDESYQRKATSYFTENSGIGRAITNYIQNNNSKQIRVGIIGLGVGTLATYGREGDYYRMYEINPAVSELVVSEDGFFRFVPDCKADIDIVIGDGRILLENEEPQQFDILALDAFSGDAPPVHLLTREAFNIYINHILEGGIIAVNISNRYLDFKPLIWQLADEFGFEGICINTFADDVITSSSTWMLLTKDKGFLRQPVLAERAEQRDKNINFKKIRLWTDDYSNLYQMLREKPLETPSNNSQIYSDQGDSHVKKGEYSKAISAYNRAIALNPMKTQLYYNRGIAYGNNGNYDKAIKDFNKVLEIDPGDTKTYFNLGIAYGRKGDFEKAISILTKAIELHPKDANAYFNRGLIHGNKGDYRMMTKDLNKAIELDPDHVPSYHSRGTVYTQAGQYDRAIADFSKVIELAPKTAQAYFDRGMVYGKRGDFDNAISDFQRVTELNPENADAYYSLGIVYGKKEDYDRAIKNLDKAIDLNPKESMAFYNRGILHSKKRDHRKTISDFTKVIELSPKNTRAYYYRGLAYTETDQFNSAIEDFSQAIELDPGYALAYNRRASAHSLNKEYEKAWRDIQKAESLGLKTDPEFIKALEEASGRKM